MRVGEDRELRTRVGAGDERSETLPSDPSIPAIAWSKEEGLESRPATGNGWSWRPLIEGAEKLQCRVDVARR
jgi:hypothetical protein